MGVTKAVILAILLVSSLLFISLYTIIKGEVEKDGEENRPCQGPVPVGYDLEHFRNTCETIPLINAK